MRINVTEEDIIAGIPRSEIACPIVLAIKNQLKIYDVEIGYHYLRIEEKYYWVSKRMLKFMVSFDNGKTVKPFCFRLENLKPCNPYIDSIPAYLYQPTSYKFA